MKVTETASVLPPDPLIYATREANQFQLDTPRTSQTTNDNVMCGLPNTPHNHIILPEGHQVEEWDAAVLDPSSTPATPNVPESTISSPLYKLSEDNKGVTIIFPLLHLQQPSSLLRRLTEASKHSRTQQTKGWGTNSKIPLPIFVAPFPQIGHTP